MVEYPMFLTGEIVGAEMLDDVTREYANYAVQVVGHTGRGYLVVRPLDAETPRSIVLRPEWFIPSSAVSS